MLAALRAVSRETLCREDAVVVVGPMERGRGGYPCDKVTRCRACVIICNLWLSTACGRMLEQTSASMQARAALGISLHLADKAVRDQC